MAGELRACAAQEAEIQAALRSAGEAVTDAEVAAQRLRDQADDAQLELSTVAERLGLTASGAEPPTTADGGEGAGTAGAASEAPASGEPAVDARADRRA